MTNREKMIILMKYRRIDRQIRRMEEEKAVWMERATSVSPVYSQVPGFGGAGGGKIISAMERIDEIEREITADIDQLADLRNVIQRGIKMMENDQLREILSYRYLSGMKWSQVAETMELDERWVRRLHLRAVDILTLESPPKYAL